MGAGGSSLGSMNPFSFITDAFKAYTEYLQNLSYSSSYSSFSSCCCFIFMMVGPMMRGGGVFSIIEYHRDNLLNQGGKILTELSSTESS